MYVRAWKPLEGRTKRESGARRFIEALKPVGRRSSAAVLNGRVRTSMAHGGCRVGPSDATRQPHVGRHALLTDERKWFSSLPTTF